MRPLLINNYQLIIDKEGIMIDNIIKRAQLNMEIKYVKERIEYHRRTIHHLQAMGMGLTDQLNKMDKKTEKESANHE